MRIPSDELPSTGLPAQWLELPGSAGHVSPLAPLPDLRKFFAFLAHPAGTPLLPADNREPDGIVPSSDMTLGDVRRLMTENRESAFRPTGPLTSPEPSGHRGNLGPRRKGGPGAGGPGGGPIPRTGAGHRAAVRLRGQGGRFGPGNSSPPGAPLHQRPRTEPPRTHPARPAAPPLQSRASGRRCRSPRRARAEPPVRLRSSPAVPAEQSPLSLQVMRTRRRASCRRRGGLEESDYRALVDPSVATKPSDSGRALKETSVRLTIGSAACATGAVASGWGVGDT